MEKREKEKNPITLLRLDELQDLFRLAFGNLIHLAGRHITFGIVEQRHADHRELVGAGAEERVFGRYLLISQNFNDDGFQLLLECVLWESCCCRRRSDVVVFLGRRSLTRSSRRPTATLGQKTR